tara:strand:+ start:12065 stop:12823 length:759 start_codon:yes stop_codon:yes gene_type:complete
MLKHRLFIDHQIIPNIEFSLTESRVHYAKHVLRLKVNSSIIIFDGSGHEYKAKITKIIRNEISILPSQSVYKENTPFRKIRIGQCIIKKDKMDLVLQKATELGVNNISPLLSEYSVIKLESKKIKSKTLHWKKIIQSSCEQSKRNYIPTMNAPETIETFINKPSENNYRIILDPKAPKSIGEISPNEKKIDLLIGPEGGFTDSEVEDAYEKGFIGVSLGYRTLRSETAAIAAIAIIQSQWGDMKADFAHKKR